VTDYTVVAEPGADLDVAAAFDWYELRRRGLGQDFLEAIRATYRRMATGPFMYTELDLGIRRALVRKFPYAVYFAVEDEVIVVLAVLHASRD
jgi:toxin ParE1/3/4